jgi:glycosyltransferase involved in cell wall biosynthesis
VHTPEPGAGAGQYVAEFVKALTASAVPTVLFCPSNFAYRQAIRESGAATVCAPLRDVGRAGFLRRVLRNIDFAAGSAKRFWMTVRRGDIVHFQFALHLGIGLLFFLIARMKGAAIALTAHDPLPHRWILPPPFRWVETTLLTISYSMCDKIIVHNEAGKKILLEHFHRDSGEVAVIPHGPLNVAPGNSFEPELADPAKPLRLLAFGSLRENKGLHLAIAALQHLRRSAGGRLVTLTVAGAIPNLMEKEYWDGCTRLIETQPGGIEVMERAIDDSEIRALFEAHDAVLLPYVDFFSDSGVAMLALSQARPIIATSAGGLGELLRETDCGILIAAPTVEAVAAAVQQAAALPWGALHAKGLNGYAHALSERSWEAIAQKTKKVYDELPPAAQKIVLHTPEPASSAALYIEALATALTAEKLPVQVVCPANHQAIGAMAEDALIEVRPCRARATQTNVSLGSKIAENTRFILSSSTTLLQAAQRDDIVHFQYILRLPFGLIFFFCALAKRARIVFTVHDPVPHKFLFPRMLRKVETATLGWAYRWSDVLIVHSEAGKRKLVEAFHVRPEKVRVIVHGPYELKKKVRPCAETSVLEVLFFGSLRENKGLHLAIEAMRQLAGEGAPVRLTIAGQVVNRNEEGYWARCRAPIERAGGSIRLLETFIPDEDLAELFSNCHCFLLPYTTFSSDSGVAYMALANAKPILSTGAGGLGWLLENSGGGIRIHEASAAGVLAALRQAMDLGPANLERMGRTGADWLLAECGWPRVARETREVYARFIPQLSAARKSAEDHVETEAFAGACHE